MQDPSIFVGEGLPVAFSSISFLFYFLPLFFIIYYLIPARAKNVVLLAGSLFFYGASRGGSCCCSRPFSLPGCSAGRCGRRPAQGGGGC